MATGPMQVPARRGGAPRLLLVTGLPLAVGLLALTLGTVGARTGYDAAARAVILEDWWRLWALPPVEAALIAGLVVWLVTRHQAGGLVRDGVPWAAGAVALVVVAVVSPLAGLAQAGLMSAHMLQHVLVGAFAPMLVLRALPHVPRGQDGPRDVLWRLTRPWLAFALWLASTVVWLVPDVHHEVLTHQILWGVQQASFFLFGLTMWAPVMERLRSAPARFGTAAKIGYLVGVWMAGLAVGNILWFSGTAFYDSHAAAAEAWGLSAIQDQANAGTVMILLHCMISFGAMAVLFFRHGREHDAAEAEEAAATLR